MSTTTRKSQLENIWKHLLNVHVLWQRNSSSIEVILRKLYLISIPKFNDVAEMHQFEMKKFQNILASEESNLLKSVYIVLLAHFLFLWKYIEKVLRVSAKASIEGIMMVSSCLIMFSYFSLNLTNYSCNQISTINSVLIAVRIMWRTGTSLEVHCLRPHFHCRLLRIWPLVGELRKGFLVIQW